MEKRVKITPETFKDMKLDVKIDVENLRPKLQRCIECNEIVSEHEPVRNCHGHCRLEL